MTELDPFFARFLLTLGLFGLILSTWVFLTLYPKSEEFVEALFVNTMAFLISVAMVAYVIIKLKKRMY